MEKNKMEAELFQTHEDLSRLMVRNASTLTPERQSMYKTPGKSFSTVSSLQQEIQELSVSMTFGYRLNRTPIS